MKRLFHIVDRSVWADAVAAGMHAPHSLAAEGFVHFSFANQVAATANRFYAGADNLCVVEVDPALLTEPVVLEDSYGSGMAFPHVYAAIPTGAAVAVHDLPRAASGAFTFSPAGSAEPASPDH
jgi:uncharacterized protein (DUF952 family)